MALNGEIKAVFLDLRRLRGVYSKENMAEIVLEIIYDYGIECKIGYFVLDNAGFNDTYVRELVQHFSLFIKAEHRRFRCFGHIINLAIKVCLYRTDTESFEIEIKTTRKLEQAKKKLKI